MRASYFAIIIRLFVDHYAFCFERAQEAVRFGGLGAEIASQIQELAFDYLDAPVSRIGAPFSPVPFSPALESHYIPDAKSIAKGVRDVMARR